MNQAQEGDHILHFAAAIEALGANQPVRQAGLQESFFQQARHGIRPVHHRAIAGFELPAGDELGDGVDDETGFTVIVGGLVEEDFLAFATFGEELFLLPARIAVDDGHGRIQNCLLRTVILLEQDGLAVGMVFFEAQNVPIIGAAPAVNRLIGVAHAKNVVMGRRQVLNQVVLGNIGVLELVDQDMPEALGIFLADIRVIGQQVGGHQE